MTPKQSLKLFEGTTICTFWDSEKEEWFFSVADVCNVLSCSQAKEHTIHLTDLPIEIKTKEGVVNL